MSGRTDKQLDKEGHPHCQRCYQRFCSQSPQNGFSCRMMDCELGCQLRFHQCKLNDHILLCPLGKVPCINKEYGCPALLARWKLGIHLETCPASVMHCCTEWNRWPLHSHEMKAKAAILLSNPRIRCAQLDVALAMRDQRMLMESLKAPVSTRRVLRNSLTCRFPAVPFDFRSSSVESDLANSADTSRTVSEDESDAPWESSTCPPGLQRSVCSQLYRASQQTTESLSDTLDVVTNHISSILSGVSEAKKQAKDHQSTDEISSSSQSNVGNLTGYENFMLKNVISTTLGQNVTSTQNIGGSSSSKGKQTPGPHLKGYSQEIENQAKRLLSLDEPMKLNEVLGVDINIECINHYQPKPRSMYTFLCAQEFRRDEYPWHFKNVHNDIHAVLNGWLEQRCPLACYGCPFSFQRFFPTEKSSEIIHSTTLESFGVKPPLEKSWAGFSKDACSDASLTIPKNSPSDCNNSNLSLSACRVREATPEISTSYKFDSDIHIKAKFENCAPGSEAESGSDTEAGDTQDLLTSLPYEILRRIMSCLDPFSLCNLALTCKHLRELCCHMLEDRGIVVQVWEKRRVGHRASWHVSYKRWFFSTAFSPVEKWIFRSHNPLAEHLKDCAYYQRSSYKAPYVKVLCHACPLLPDIMFSKPSPDS